MKKKTQIKIPIYIFCLLLFISYKIIQHWDDFKLGISGGW